MTITHCSDLAEYRDPPGAVRTGSSVLLRLRVEDADPLSVRLRVFWEDSPTDLEMNLIDGYWQTIYTVPAMEGVAWYLFVLELPIGEALSSDDTPETRVVYYGAPYNRNQGEGCLYDSLCPSFQLTVFDRSFDTPAWFRGKIMYQIFPDRFCQGDPSNLQRGIAYHRSMGRTVTVHEQWDETPLFEPLPGQESYSPCDFFGGDLRGIIRSLEYLASLGVTTVYLNPVVESASNHRYDTADYMRVDPILGTNEEFAELCREAARHGISIMMDGVYSHTGSDSRYFNKQENYAEDGAFQGAKSPYYHWYTFYTSRHHYKCWWGFDTLPEVNERDPSWQRYVITGKDSVFRHWQNLGTRGLRLDVADELPDDVIELMRTYWKRGDPNRVLLGEVWEDATTKKSYGVNRRYALGKGLDSVMNYPFRDAAVAFLTGTTNAFGLAEFFTGQSLNYPRPMYHALMNLLSSHDICRIRTRLAAGTDGKELSREEQAQFPISSELDHGAAQKQKLAAALQFLLPGVPCIYYGDEYGMLGWRDPFNRGTFVRRDPDMFSWYRTLSSLRCAYPVLQTGGASFLVLDDDVLAVLRYCFGGVDACGSPAAPAAALILLNRGAPHTVTVRLHHFRSGMTEQEEWAWEAFPAQWAESILASPERFPIRERCLCLPLAASSVRVLRLL